MVFDPDVDEREPSVKENWCGDEREIPLKPSSLRSGI